MALPLSTILTRPPDVEVVTPSELGVSYPGADLVSAAAGLFNRETYPEQVARFAPANVVDHAGNLLPSAQRTLELFGPEAVQVHTERLMVEGPRFRVEVAPGLVAFRSSDPARAERSAERALADHASRVRESVLRMEAGLAEPEPAPQRGVTSWSPKSRARMVQRMAELDYAALLDQAGRLALLTLTYPGDWLTVAPDSATCHKHLLRLRKRFERFYGRPLVAVWKREFQLRGAPHYHLLVMAPEDRNGLTFRAWVAQAWADIVAHPDPVERGRHLLAGTGVDYAEGSRFRDPKRAGVYFSKHGAFSAKEYQNRAPEEWAGGSVGRFWGYWHLSPAVAAVEVAPDVHKAAMRTARRYADANSYQVQVERWRKVTTVDRETGELGWKWRKRRTRVWVRRLRGQGGYLVVNDGPAFAGQLARYAAQVSVPRTVKVKSGRRLMAGPAGFLP